MGSEKDAAAIFDMDGVLIDSYWAHFQSWQSIAEDTGRAMTQEAFARTFGRTSREVIPTIWPEKQFSSDEIAALDAKKEKAFRRILEKEFPAMPGARELVNSLDLAGFAVAVGSSGPPENVEMAIDRLGIRHTVHAVVTGADVHRGKPDPQVFELAAARLDHQPQRCVVFEDAPDGVQAGHAAGMVVVALVSTGRDKQSLSHANLVVESLEELSPQTLRDLIERKT